MMTRSGGVLGSVTGFGGFVGGVRFMRKGGRSSGPEGSFSDHVTARTPKLAPATLGGAFVALAACAADAPPPRAPPRPPVSAAAPPPAPKVVPADGSFYQPVDANVRVVLTPSDLPLSDAQIVRPDGAEAHWARAPELLRGRVRRSGFAVATGAGRARMGELYLSLRDARVPFL